MVEDYCYGAKPDSFDYTDLKKRYSYYKVPSTQSLPVDLRGYVDQVYDQGKLNSCTANAVCSVLAMDLKKQGYAGFNPSRLFLFYNTREMSYYSFSSEYSIRDTLKAMSRHGVCNEHSWPYSDSFYRHRDKPPKSCFKAAKANTLYKYKRLEQDIGQLRACLSKKCPFVFGFKVYKTFAKRMRKCGCMPMQTKDDRSYSFSSKGQALVAVGFDDKKECVTVLNSWGKDWGDDGYFYMPYDVITDKDMCFDFWKLTFSHSDMSAYKSASLDLVPLPVPSLPTAHSYLSYSLTGSSGALSGNRLSITAEPAKTLPEMCEQTGASAETFTSAPTPFTFLPLPNLFSGPLPNLLSGPLPNLFSGPLPNLLSGPLPNLFNGPLPNLLSGVTAETIEPTVAEMSSSEPTEGTEPVVAETLPTVAEVSVAEISVPTPMETAVEEDVGTHQTLHCNITLQEFNEFYTVGHA